MLTLSLVASFGVVEMDPRELILKRLNELGHSPYWLVQQVKGELGENTVYAYLRGESDMRGNNLAKLFVVLDLEVTPKKKK